MQSTHHGERGALTQGQLGMTVLELMITLVVIGFISVIGVNGIRFVTQSSLREDTTEVAAVLRAAYNMATTAATHHRVVFNLDEQTYVIEQCQGEVTLTKSDSEEQPEPQGEGKGKAEAEQPDLAAIARDRGIPEEMLTSQDPEQAAKLAAALTGEAVPGGQCAPADLPTGDAEGRGAMRKIRTEEKIKIRGIWVQHLNGEQTSGQVSVNFFPLGYSEKAVIEIGDEDGNYYSLLVHSFTGRVEFRNGKVQAEQFMTYRADGEEEEERGEE